jgi:hypothetical protein
MTISAVAIISVKKRRRQRDGRIGKLWCRQWFSARISERGIQHFVLNAGGHLGVKLPFPFPFSSFLPLSIYSFTFPPFPSPFIAVSDVYPPGKTP